VVLHGTGKRAFLEGYTSAGKTGTAQKVDPLTHAYSHTKYVGSFAGFAPINNPVITVAVVLDSAVGLHQGGQVSAPVFHRISQQVLEYLHTPHDVELPASRQLWLASKRAKDEDLSEGSPDHPGETVDVAEAAANPLSPPADHAPSAPPPSAGANVLPAALRQREALPTPEPDEASLSAPAQPLAPMPSHGTVVLDVEQTGVIVPSFVGKSVRAAIEMAEDTGVDLDVVGTGLAFEQSPSPGTRVPSGAKVTVRFAR
jgi:cell division protein FtsI (penicillin-binding protein 3)